MDHLDKGTLDLGELRFVVLDEADEMLNMGFAEDVEQILSGTPENKQVALFSRDDAGADPADRQAARPGATEITVKSTSTTAANVAQRYLKVAHAQKLDALTRILEVENFDGMIVFVRTKHATEELAERLRARGFSAAAINGDVAQAQRERTIDQLRKGKLDILVATDVAARGLDVERISHVVNHDIPTDTESYVHRIGRTGRAGRSGAAISFVTPRENHLLRAIEKANRTTLEEMSLPPSRTSTRSGSRSSPRRSRQALGDPQLETFRELVAAYEREHDVPARTSRRRSPCSPRTASRCCWRTCRSRPGPRARSGRDAAAAARNRGALADRGRQAAPRRAPPDRRRARQRGRPRARDFGRIDIKPAFSLVELPADLPPKALAARDTRICGVLIDIKPDTFVPLRTQRSSQGARPGKPGTAGTS